MAIGVTDVSFPACLELIEQGELDEAERIARKINDSLTRSELFARISVLYIEQKQVEKGNALAREVEGLAKIARRYFKSGKDEDGITVLKCPGVESCDLISMIVVLTEPMNLQTAYKIYQLIPADLILRRGEALQKIYFSFISKYNQISTEYPSRKFEKWIDAEDRFRRTFYGPKRDVDAAAIHLEQMITLFEKSRSKQKPSSMQISTQELGVSQGGSQIF